MNNKLKKTLTGVLCLLVFAALVVCAPVSRLVYSIYDNNRTNEILAQLEAEKAAAQAGESTAVNTFHKQAYLSTSEETSGDKKLETTHLLVLTSENTYELNFYERTVKGDSSYTSEYFRMTGAYTREGNVLTVEPGIGVLALSQDGSSYTYYNAQYLTAEEAAGDKTRDEVYDMKYTSRQIALMQDGSFVVGGKSDAAEELPAPAGRHVYTDFIAQGRKTYKTLVTLDDGTYYVYSQATNSNNAEQTTGALFGYSTYEIKDANKGIIPDETRPEETYDIVTGEAGIGYMYANNNGSHMHFDLQTHSGFLSWLSTSFNAPSPTFYVSESGFTMKIGALKTVVAPWGLYVPSGETAEPEATEAPAAPEAPTAQDVRLELETSVEGKPFVLELKADGSLRSGWTNYEQTMMDGSWKVENGTLVLDMPYPATIVDNNGSLDITVNYGQMGEKVYTMSAEQFAALTGAEVAAPAGQDVTLELETSVEGKPFVLELKADGTLRSGWTNYEQTMMDGSWKVENGTLVLDMPYPATIADNNGTLEITVNYGQMGEKVYTMSGEQLAALTGVEVAAPAGQDVTLELETSVEGKPFVLELKSDGSLRSGWTNYEQTMMDGSWKVEGGNLVLDMTYPATIVDNNGNLDITVNYGQMGEKVYSMTAEQFAALTGAEVAAPAGRDVTLELETSVEGKPFVLELKADGSLRSGWTNYEQTMMDGSWKVEGGKLVLDMPYTATIVDNNGSLDITVNYGQMGEKVYSMTAEQFAALTGAEVAAPAGQDVTLEVETSVEGKPFVLELKADGSLRSGWTNYEQTMMDGSWKVEGGNLVLDMAYPATIVTNADGSLTITVNYGQMGEKVYTMTAEQFALLTK